MALAKCKLCLGLGVKMRVGEKVWQGNAFGYKYADANGRKWHGRVCPTCKVAKTRREKLAKDSVNKG